MSEAPDTTVPKAPPAMADDSASLSEAEALGRGKRQDHVATTLIGATATVAALLTLLGASSDRVWVILDDSTAKKLMFATALLVAMTIALGLSALLAENQRAATGRLLLGTVSFVAALTGTVWTASSGANQFARPTFTQITVERGSPEPMVLHFAVHAESVDASQRIGVKVVDDQQRILFDATLPPDAAGVADQEVVLPLRGGTRSLLMSAWHRDGSTTGSDQPSCNDLSAVPDGTACIVVNL